MILQYPVDLTAEESGQIAGLFGSLPGKTWGHDESDALIRAADALIIVLAGYVDAGERIPLPSPARGRPVVSVAPLEAAKVRLHNAMLDAGVSDADMARTLGLPKSVVQQLRNPIFPGELAEVEMAFAALLAADKSQSDVSA